MNEQLAALALVISEQRITIGRQAAELQARDALIAELQARSESEAVPAGS